MGYFRYAIGLHELANHRARAWPCWLKDVIDRTVKRTALAPQALNSSARLFRLVGSDPHHQPCCVVASGGHRPLAAGDTASCLMLFLSLSRDETAASGGDFTVEMKRKQSERHVYCPSCFRPVELKTPAPAGGCLQPSEELIGYLRRGRQKQLCVHTSQRRVRRHKIFSSIRCAFRLFTARNTRREP
jgi:hypothetical protein